MPKFSDMFPSDVEPGMYSSAMLDEIEREKARERLRSMLGEKRKQKIAQINADRAPELPVDLSPEPTSQPKQSVSPTVPDMMPEPQGSQPSRFDPNTYQPEPTPKAAPLAGFAPRPEEDDELDSRKMLYDYLKNRRASEPAFQEQYKELSRDAEAGRVLSQWASGLGEMASMAGTLQGKRSDPGDMKSLPAAIYGGMRRNADELMGLRRLSNNEQVSDIRMLRDIERGDLDALRTQKILQDMQRQRQQPKTLPYFVPGDENNPPRMVMMDSEGNIQYRELPPGARPSNETYMMGEPVYVDGKLVYPQTATKSGQTKFFEGPAGAKTAKQIQIENQAQADEADRRLKEIEAEQKSASEADKRRLEQEKFNLNKSIFEWKKSQNKGEKPQKDIAGETLDRAFAKDYEKYISTGGKQSVLQSLRTLKEAREQLVKMKWPSRMVGAFGQTGIDYMAPELAEVMNKVRGVVQTDLRNSLGAAFTEREGEQFMSRAFNPRATKEVNIANIDREIAKIAAKAEAFQNSVDYFEKNRTLRGFKSNVITGPTEPGTQNVRKQHNRQLNKTRFIYPDGRIEEKEGIL